MFYAPLLVSQLLLFLLRKDSPAEKADLHRYGLAGLLLLFMDVLLNIWYETPGHWDKLFCRYVPTALT